MPSPFSNGVQNADKIFDLFSDGLVTAGSATLTTADAAMGIAHGLGATPDFVIAMSSLAVGAGAASGKFGWSAGATTITFTKADTGAPETFSYIVAKLA
jgi:hypothetical protein